MKTLFGWLIAACLLAACGSPDEGPELGAFEPITKKETDEPFDLTAPSSKSPGAFSFTSSNQAVATVDGKRVTIRGVGETTITASQPRSGSFGPTHKSTTLTVSAVPCEAGQVRVGASCEAVPSCTSPATLNKVSNRCIAPATTGTPVSFGGLTWMSVTRSDTWAKADAFCRGSVIGNQEGWRLPTRAELAALYASGEMANRNWELGPTWAEEMATGLAAEGHVTVDLRNGDRIERGVDAGAYVACVR